MDFLVANIVQKHGVRMLPTLGFWDEMMFGNPLAVSKWSFTDNTNFFLIKR